MNYAIVLLALSLICAIVGFVDSNTMLQIYAFLPGAASAIGFWCEFNTEND